VRRLCAEIRSALPNPKTGKSTSRFGRVLLAFNHIKACVDNNATVRERTRIQLPKLNTLTIRQW
jgi:hypothetical protein